jgi:hypothetical protein
MMSKIKTFSLLFSLVFSSISYTSCSRGYGCPAESANVKPDRKGRYGNKKGSSNLFPKDMRKRVHTN